MTETVKRITMRKDSLRAKYGQPAAPLLDTAEYPQRWRDYVGQEPAVKMLQVAAASARMRKAPLDHVLIAHPTPGIGKTALGALVAAELRRPARIISGRITGDKARMIFAEMEDRDVLVIDEAHQIAEGGKAQAEWLLHVLQDGVLMGPFGPEVQPKVTIIAITTHPQKLPPAVIDRFMLVPPMQQYDTAEAARIAQIMAPRLFEDKLPNLGKQDATRLAMAAGNNPRSIKRLLMSLRDMTITRALPLVDGRYDVPGLLDWHGITQDGLTPVAQQYLVALAQDFDGKAGVKALEDRLQQPQGLAEVERVLMDRGLVARQRNGRTLSQAGIARARQLTT